MAIMQAKHTPAAVAASKDRTMSKEKRPWGLYIGRALIAVIAILAWHVAVTTGFANPAFVSSPTAVYHAIGALLAQSDFWSNLGTTALEVLISFVASVFLGIAAAVTLDRNARIRALVSPYVSAINSMPRVALGPIFILWFGIGIASKVVLATSLGFFIVLVSTLGGLQTVDRDILLMSKLYGASNLRLFWNVRLPWALPSVFAGMKLTLIYCASGAVIGEMIAAKSGIGLLLQTYSGQFDIASVLGVMFVLVACVVFVTSCIEYVERSLLRWAKGITDIPG
jgi:NitT/TauT family transport system permease protein